jgi:hypothetical protein
MQVTVSMAVGIGRLIGNLFAPLARRCDGRSHDIRRWWRFIVAGYTEFDF